MIYLQLFLGFLKIGAFSFGGGYGAIPLIRETVLSYGWLKDEAITYIIAVSESTPGPVMVNTATYVGTETGGVLGAFIATFAVVLPAFLIMLFAAVILKKIINSRFWQRCMTGLVPCVIGTIAATGTVMISNNCVTNSGAFDLAGTIFTSVVAIVYFGSKKVMKKGLSPIIIILISAVAGIVVYGV